MWCAALWPVEFLRACGRRPLTGTAGKVPARQAVNAASVFEYVLRVGIFGGVLVWSVVPL